MPFIYSVITLSFSSKNSFGERTPFPPSLLLSIKPLKPSLGSYVTFLGSEHSARLLPGPQAVSNPLPTHIPLPLFLTISLGAF